MPFLNVINYKTLYGERTTTTAKNLEKLTIKRTRIEEHIKFLKACKIHNLLPKVFIIKNKTNYIRKKELIHNTMVKMRNNTLNWR